MSSLLVKAAVFAALAAPSFAATYSSADTYVGSSFFDGFEHEAIADPTNGRVNYVDESTARSLNLSYASDTSFVMRADSTTVLSSSGPGRNSVRIASNKYYTQHVVVFDIRHMPQGCGTWPAAWELGDNWPSNGEIDVVEGVNDVSPNQATLHTSPGCTMPSSGDQTGTTVTTNCDTSVNGNAGCGVRMAGSNSYGPSFNSNGGGIYAMERTSNTVSVWFWPRGSSMPSDISSPGSSVNTDNWGTPAALFPSTSSCDLSSKLGPQKIIINLTLCGDYAGAVYNQDGCSGSCVDNVNNNPGAFTDAYWDIAAVRTYE